MSELRNLPVEGLIDHNRQMHDLLAPVYEGRHREIFNPVEQRRIHELLRSLLLQTPAQAAPSVLDFGSGTGNLTLQLLGLDADVVAADVSEGSLRELRATAGRRSSLKTRVLNGRDLHGFDSGAFDMVATYSVLHHVPDYLAVVDEFVRVARAGGIIYIDHEVCPSYWEDDPEYLAYLADLERSRPSLAESLLHALPKLLTCKGWRYLWGRLRLQGAEIADDGDIHVHKEDHIDWAAIRERLEPCCDIVAQEDYLVCREQQDPPPVWSRWRNRCADMRLIVARKR
jgi:SAM-dependent methyltransferase